MKTGSPDQTKQLMEQLRRTWLTWGVLPLAFCAIIALFVTGLASTSMLTAREKELHFEVLFAISAGLFLIGFYLDSYWTSAQKLARRIAVAAGVQQQDIEQAQTLRQRNRLAETLAPHNSIAQASIVSSNIALTFIGGIIAVVAILAAAAHLGWQYAPILLLMAAEYQLFVFSRHTFYREVLSAATSGELIVVAKTGTDK